MLQPFTTDIQDTGSYLLYIYSPFCGTCHIARSMLEKIEEIHGSTLFAEMNASYEEAFMRAQEIESVPCLLIVDEHEVKEKIYTFHSVAHMYTYVHKYFPQYFQ